jgi:hypothetical protein
MPFIGRELQTEYLDGLLTSGEAGFLAIYGRRRVGKTFLVREYLKDPLAFELTGMLDAPLADQLVNFQTVGAGDSAMAGSWQQAFAQLADFLLTLNEGRRGEIRRCRRSIRLMRVLENLFHGSAEFFGNPICEIERRVVFFGFQRVDRLTRDADAFAEFFLRPVALRAQDFEAVFHQCEVRMKGETRPQQAHNRGSTIASGKCGALA